jgi:hypothetical protein
LWIKPFANAEEQLELISIVEVMEIMNTTETKGTWPDGITNVMFKQLPMVAVEAYAA